MPTSVRQDRIPNRRSGSRLGFFLLGSLFTLLAVPAGIWLYLRLGQPPVATADKPFPYEHAIVDIPLRARIDRTLQQPPFGTSEDVFESGARLYVAECARCHGVPGHEVAMAKYMYPTAPQLWKKHTHGNVVGVSDDPAGETYWKISHGIRLSGMPAYNHLLSDTQMWQIALLLKSADQPLPDPVRALLASPPLTAFSAGSAFQHP